MRKAWLWDDETCARNWPRNSESVNSQDAESDDRVHHQLDIFVIARMIDDNVVPGGVLAGQNVKADPSTNFS